MDSYHLNSTHFDQIFKRLSYMGTWRVRKPWRTFDHVPLTLTDFPGVFPSGSDENFTWKYNAENLYRYSKQNK